MAENGVLLPLLSQAEVRVITENLCPAETILGKHAPFSKHISMQIAGETHSNLTNNEEGEQRTRTEHFWSSPSSCNAEDGWSEAASLPAIINAEDFSLKDDVEGSLSDRECSDVDLDNGWVESEDHDSDSSIDSINNRKENKRLRPFFEMLKHIAIGPTAENAQDTLFYCPACRGSGLGETSVYKGFKPLLAHAKQYKKRRLKLHRDFAALLEEDLKRRGIITAESCQVNPFLKQISLMEDEKCTSPLIVWPPMVVIQSRGFAADVHHKREGLKSREILEIFKDYHPRKVTQAYVHEGNSGLSSLLVFQDSPVGYMQAKRLAKNFKCSKRGRMDWNDLGSLASQPCSHGMLYGYMAKEEDMLMFNTCDARKKKVKWDLKRYQDVVMEPLILMHEAKLENNWLKSKLQAQEEHNKELGKILSKLYAKQEIEAEEGDIASQVATKQFQAPAKEMETSCDGDGDNW